METTTIWLIDNYEESEYIAFKNENDAKRYMFDYYRTNFSKLYSSLTDCQRLFARVRDGLDNLTEGFIEDVMCIRKVELRG